MKCYYDQTQDAVGFCKSCLRALSHEYLVDMGKGLACKNRCEADVTKLISAMDAYQKAYATHNQAVGKAVNALDRTLKSSVSLSYGSSIFSIVLGVLFIWSEIQNPSYSFLFYCGVIFLAYGVWRGIRIALYSKLLKSVNSRLDD